MAHLIDNKRQTFPSAGAVKMFLRRKGIPEGTVKALTATLIDEAMRQNDALSMSRFFTAYALALLEEGMETERILEILRKTDQQMGRVSSGENTWAELMEELKEKTGVYINCDPEWSEAELPPEYEEVT